MKKLIIPVILFLFTYCEPVTPQQSINTKKLVLDDHNYEELTGNVQLVPVTNGSPGYLDNPVLFLDRAEPLFLQFDLLTDQFEYLSAKVYHCNKNWSRSRLRDMEFLDEINAFRINTYDYSLNTTQPYIRYGFELPVPRLSGNYILAVHRRSTPDDLLFTRKFLVVDPKCSIDQNVRISTTVAKRDQHHQLEFSITYQNVQVNVPNRDLSVSILQNHRWQDAINHIQPTLIRPTENYIEFRNLDLSSSFPGWNEFRYFDMRTLDITGRNVAKITTINDRVHASLGTDRSRAPVTYTQTLQDINGNYVLQNRDVSENPLNSDYANVHFTLLEEPIKGKVYVAGRFNNWKLEDENRMKFDSTKGVYRTSLLLKQGYYDYSYWVADGNVPPYAFEGSHFQTENDYEILVYYRNPGNVYDELIGYKKFSSRN